MTDRPYHHGNLRTALLEQAERTRARARRAGRCRCASWRATSASATARRAATSPTARRCSTRWPRPGSRGSAPSCARAVDGAGADFEARLQATAAAYVRFATRDAALLELMFAGKHREESGTLHEAAEPRLRRAARADRAGPGPGRARARLARARRPRPVRHGAGHRRAGHRRHGAGRAARRARARRDRALPARLARGRVVAARYGTRRTGIRQFRGCRAGPAGVRSPDPNDHGARRRRHPGKETSWSSTESSVATAGRPAEDLAVAAARSNVEGDKPGSGVRWIRSYVIAEDSGEVGTFCVYEADSPEAIRAHARAAELPVDEVVPIADTVIVRLGSGARRRLTAAILPAWTRAPRSFGRAAECEQLARAVERARRGTGSLLLLAGEAGVGKTRLAEAAATASSALVLRGAASSSAVAPYAPIVAVLRAYLRGRPGGFDGLGALRDHLALLLPELGRPAAAGDRATIFEAVRAGLAQIAAEQHVLVLLDDLQWSDDATLELLAGLAPELDALPVLVVGAYRSDGLPRDHVLRWLRNELRRGGTARRAGAGAARPGRDGGAAGRAAARARVAGARPHAARPDPGPPLLRRGARPRPRRERTAAGGPARPRARRRRRGARARHRPRRGADERLRAVGAGARRGRGRGRRRRGLRPAARRAARTRGGAGRAAAARHPPRGRERPCELPPRAQPGSVLRRRAVAAPPHRPPPARGGARDGRRAGDGDRDPLAGRARCHPCPGGARPGGAGVRGRVRVPRRDERRAPGARAVAGRRAGRRTDRGAGALRPLRPAVGRAARGGEGLARAVGHAQRPRRAPRLRRLPAPARRRVRAQGRARAGVRRPARRRRCVRRRGPAGRGRGRAPRDGEPPPDRRAIRRGHRARRRRIRGRRARRPPRPPRAGARARGRRAREVGGVRARPRDRPRRSRAGARARPHRRRRRALPAARARALRQRRLPPRRGGPRHRARPLPARARRRHGGRLRHLPGVRPARARRVVARRRPCATS